MAITKEDKLKLFEYSIIQLANWYVEVEKLQNLTEFNLFNDFGKEKSLLFPFFICTANGHREILFNGFDYFKPIEDGIVEQDIFEQIEFSNHIIFGSNKAILNRSILKLENLEEALIEEIFNGPSDEIKSLVKAINESVRCIRFEREIPEFVTFNLESLQYNSIEHSSWKVFNGNDEFLEIFNNNKRRIPIAYLINEKSVFASESFNRLPSYR